MYTLLFPFFSFRYQQDRYFTVATKRWHLPAELRPALDVPFFPRGFVVHNTPEQCTVLLSLPVGRPSLVVIPAFNYDLVLADCLHALPDDPSSGPKKESWRVFVAARKQRGSQSALLPIALPSRSVGPLAAAQLQPLAFHGPASAPVVEQPATIASSLKPRPEGQTQPAQERANQRGTALVGRRVRKVFGGKWKGTFEGRIVAYLNPQTTGRASSLWRVSYDSDNSVEDYSLGTLNKILLPVSVRTEGGGGSSSSSSSSLAASFSSSSSSSSSSASSSSSSSSSPSACPPQTQASANSKGAASNPVAARGKGRCKAVPMNGDVDSELESDPNFESESDSDSGYSDCGVGCRQCSFGRKCRLQGRPGHSPLV
jgi:hypothetical protein